MLITPLFCEQTIGDFLHRFNDWYEIYCYTEEKEPTVINVYRISRHSNSERSFNNYYPVKNVCIFSKEQAIRELFRLHSDYAEENYAKTSYHIKLGCNWGKFYTTSAQ